MDCTGGGFPNAKLASLQKVLSSDFFSAVREVYEHVYETVDLSGSVEVRANATAKVQKTSCQLSRFLKKKICRHYYMVYDCCFTTATATSRSDDHILARIHSTRNSP